MSHSGRATKSSSAVARRLRAAPNEVAGASHGPLASRRDLRIGAWRLTGLISRGQAIAIYRARSVNELQGPGCYAIKTISAQGERAKIGLSFLQREVAVAAEVVHPNLLAVLTAHWQGDCPHTTLPYLEGVALRRLLAEAHTRVALAGPVLPIAYWLRIARQAAAALAAMHANGWLHGQVRPEHVVISPQGHATLIDLTFARRLGGAECAAEGAAGAAAGYSAPEAFVRRGRLTAAADIYSVGVLLYEALAGEPPFRAADPQQLAMRHRFEAPPELRRHCPRASREVSELVRRMLAKEPLRRPAANELVRWLAELEIEELASS